MRGLLFILVFSALFIRSTSVSIKESKFNFTNELRRFTRSTDDENGDKRLIQALVFVIIFLILLAFVLSVYLCYKHQRLNREDSAENLQEDVATKVQKQPVDYDDLRKRFEIIETNLIPAGEGDELGEGYFGFVEKYKLKHVNENRTLLVAVKKAKRDKLKRELLHLEIRIMAEIPKHPNILALVGMVTKNQEELLCVTELAHCDLKHYLARFLDSIRTRSKNYVFENLIEKDENEKKTGKYSMENFEFSNNLERLSTFDLILFAFQISRGMEYLATIPCVHRDLALRNILITEDKIVKIGDFGHARQHDKDKQYYTHHTNERLSTRMAPEIVLGDDNHINKYGEKSDVWPCGLVFYEIFNLSERHEEPVVSTIDDLQSEISPIEPKYCLRETFEFIKFCWNESPGRRPTFAQCKLHFEIELKKFPDQMFSKITSMLELETDRQNKLESWVRKDCQHETAPQEETERSSLLNSDQSETTV